MRGIAGRAGAVLAAAVATAAVYVLVVHGGNGEDGSAERDGRGQADERVRALVQGLSVEEKVDSILLLGFHGEDASAPIVEELGERTVGGVLVGSRNWADASRGAALIGELKAAGIAGGRAPPLIVAKQEGGEYRAFADLPPAERQLDIGDAAMPEKAEAWARETGEALREAGFDLNLAPVADVATLDTPVADRSFSDDPAIAAEMTAAAVRGCQKAGIACAVRHFPGLGAASQETDEGPATVALDAASLAARDLVPFEAAVAEGVAAVVLSHAFYSAFDPVTPASLAPEVATELLRGELGFRGVAITDDLGAGAIKAVGGVARAAVGAVRAGADLLLIESPADQAGVRKELLAAVASGEVSRRRLDQAVGRVLELKRSLGLLD